MKNAYELASLDMAGTTVDENELVYRVMRDTVESATGLTIEPKVLAKFKGTSKWEAIQGLLTKLGCPSTVRDVDPLFERFQADLVAAYGATPPTPMPGVEELFTALRSRGIKVALQTGYSAPIAAAIFKGLGWSVGPEASDTVDALITSDTVAASRPAPFLIFHTMEATGVTDVSKVLVAGDTPNDLKAGKRAGVGFVVGVTSGTFDEAALAKRHHTHILDSVTGIAAIAGEKAQKAYEEAREASAVAV